MDYLTREASAEKFPQTQEIKNSQTQADDKKIPSAGGKKSFPSLPKISRVIQKPPAVPSPKTSAEHVYVPLSSQETPNSKTPATIKRESVKNIINLFERQNSVIVKTVSQKEIKSAPRSPLPDPPSIEEKKESSPLSSQSGKAEKSLKEPLSARRIKVPPLKPLRQTKSSSAIEFADLPESLTKTIAKVLELGEALVKAEAIKNKQDPEQVLELFRHKMKEKSFNSTVRLETVWKEIEGMVSGLLQESKINSAKTPGERKILDKIFGKLLPSFKDLQLEKNHKKFKRFEINPQQEEILVLSQLSEKLHGLVKELEAVKEGKDLKKQFQSPVAQKIYEIISHNKEAKSSGIANTAHMIAQEIRAYINLEEGLDNTLLARVKGMGIHRTTLKNHMLAQLQKHNENFSLELGRLIGGNYVDILSNQGSARSFIDELYYGDYRLDVKGTHPDYRMTTYVEKEREQVTSMLLATEAFSPTTVNDRKAKEYRAHMKDLLVRAGKQYEIPESLLLPLLDKILSDIPKDNPENAISDFRALRRYLSETPEKVDRLRQFMTNAEAASPQKNNLLFAVDGALQFAQEIGLRVDQYDSLKRLAQNSKGSEADAEELLSHLKQLMNLITARTDQLALLLPTLDAFLGNYDKNQKLEFELAKEYREKIHSMMELFAKMLHIEPESSLYSDLEAFIPKKIDEPWLDDPEYVFSEFGRFYNHLCHEYEKGDDPKMRQLITLMRTSSQQFLLSLGTALFHASKTLLNKEYKTDADPSWTDQQWKKNNFIFGDSSTNVVIERVGRLNVNPQILVSQVIELEFKEGYEQNDLKMLLVLRRDPSVKIDPKAIPNYEPDYQVIESFKHLAHLMDIGLKIYR